MSTAPKEPVSVIDSNTASADARRADSTDNPWNDRTGMTTDIDTIVIGAGVVGLAAAVALCARGAEVVVLERNERIGAETSARNSQVIHAGLYYPPGSLKARLCVDGRERIYRFVAENGVGFERCGKLLVAVEPGEIEKLLSIAAIARANGVGDLVRLGPADVAALEPEVSCAAAILSPSTGIVDGHALLVALEGHLSGGNGSVVLATEVIGAARTGRGMFRLEIRGGDGVSTITCRRLVIAAGHGAQALAASLFAGATYQPPPRYFAKGHYFALSGRSPFRHLVYPMPVAGGLGVHLTLDLAGRARFGPDVTWIATLDYRFDEAGGGRQRDFETSIRRYWPGLPDGALHPDFTGVRPKLSGPNEPAADFAIHGAATHGIPGLVALYGIESPGLTAALAIGAYAADLLAE